MTNKENEPDDIISLDAVRDFLQRNGGKVKQTDLVNHFRVQLSSPHTKVRARQEFKDILQLITAVKTENGEKHIILIKQVQEHFQASVISRKAQRPLSVRKELAKSKFDFLLHHDKKDNSDDEDCSSLSSHNTDNTDSGISFSITPSQSVSSLKNALSSRMKSTQSMDSINTMLTDEDVGDLEDDIGLNDGLDVLPEEKEWLLASAHGHMDKLEKLLKGHPKLARKKDFIMGYTALHWAAKLGRADMLKFVISSGGDVHSRSHGGYTPLHLAAICGQEQMITLLIELYGANIHSRDHSGFKPKDVVKETVSSDIQRKLGRSLILGTEIVQHTVARTAVTRKQSFYHSDGEITASTPELARRHMKSITASAHRSMSFLKKKKKNIEPRLKLENIPGSTVLATKKRSSQSSEPDIKPRPRSQILNLSPPEPDLNPTLSFEI